MVWIFMAAESVAADGWHGHAAVGVAMPFLRRGAIGGMLSSPVQNVLTRQYPQIPGRTLGAAGGLLAAEGEEEQRRRLGLMQ